MMRNVMTSDSGTITGRARRFRPLFLLGLALSLPTNAVLAAPSEVRAWVYFTDKGLQDPASQAQARREAIARLDPHALARRTKTFGPALIDARDLPVNPEYLARVQDLGAVIRNRSRWLNAASVRADGEILRRIQTLPFVRRVAPVAEGRVDRPAPSPESQGARRLGGERDLLDYGPSLAQLEEIGVVAAHQRGLSGRGVRIGMMDTGYWRDHPTFQRLLGEGLLVAQWDFINHDGETEDGPGDPAGQQNHGTSTWSLIGGFTQGELIGAAYEAELLLAKTEDTSGEYPAEEDNWIAAMEWADSLGADILSTSLDYIQWYTYRDMDGDTAPITIASDIAAGRGMVVVVAAGNWGTQDWYYIGAPADGDSVIAVGASQADDTNWPDSSHGPTYDGRTKPEVAARGAGTYCAVVPTQGNNDLYRFTNGTSVACPLVAGAAALILEAHPDWPAMRVREALMMTADRASHPDNDLGWGRINVISALSYAPAAAPGARPAEAPRLIIAPNPSVAPIEILLRAGNAEKGFADSGRLDLFSASGALVRSFAMPVSGERVAWDGADAQGRPVAAGVYVARWRAGSRVVSARVVRAR